MFSNKSINIYSVSLAISIVYFYWVGKFYIQFVCHGSIFLAIVTSSYYYNVHEKLSQCSFEEITVQKKGNTVQISYFIKFAQKSNLVPRAISGEGANQQYVFLVFQD